MPATAMLLCMGLFSIFWLEARAASALAAVFPVDDRSMACQAVARGPRSPPSPDGLRRGSPAGLEPATSRYERQKPAAISLQAATIVALSPVTPKLTATVGLP